MIKLAPKLKTKSKDMTVATVTRAAELPRSSSAHSKQKSIG